MWMLLLQSEQLFSSSASVCSLYTYARLQKCCCIWHLQNQLLNLSTISYSLSSLACPCGRVILETGRDRLCSGLCLP